MELNTKRSSSRQRSIIQDEIEVRRQRLKRDSNLVWKKIRNQLVRFLTLKNIANLVFVLTICIICWQQCYLQVSEYLEFKTRVQVNHHYPSSTIWLAPGVTICNNNRLRFEKLAEEIPALRGKVDELAANLSRVESMDWKRINLMHPLKTIVDKNVNISHRIIESSMAKLMELSRSRMIEDINCNTAFGKQINCENIRIVESFQDSPCYTLFHLGSVLEALATGDAYDFNKSLLNGSRKMTSFDKHEVADILVNFDPIQHADYHRDIGGKVKIHSTAHIGSLRDAAHLIVPGNKYDIIVQRYMSKRLPPPYESMCVDYKKKNSIKFMEKVGTFASVELDKTSCTRNCITRLSTKHCNCWPVEIPFFPNDDSIVENANSYKKCSWGDANLKGNFSIENFVDCYRKFHADCRGQCQHGCRTEDYKVQVMSNPWPQANRFDSAANNRERRRLHRLRGCCAMISIKYLEFMETRRTMYPKLTLAQMVSNIGGIVSALVGVSTVTIYRYFTRRVFHCKIVSNIKPTDIID